MYDFLRPGVSAANADLSTALSSSLLCNSSGIGCSEGFFKDDLRPGLLQFDGFVEVVLQGRSFARNLPKRGEFNPPPGLRMLSNPLENVLGSLSSAPLKNENAHDSLSGITIATFFFRKVKTVCPI